MKKEISERDIRKRNSTKLDYNKKEKKKRGVELMTWVYAHRGLHEKPHIPENSMAAFRRAVENGFGIELDVHLTLDKKLAVIHDSVLERTAGVNLKIEEITLEEAQKYNLEESTERICELHDVLEMNGGRTPFVIELKAAGGNEEELVHTAMRELRQYKGLYCVESFSPTAIKYMRLYYPDVVRGQLAGNLIKGAVDKEIEVKTFITDVREYGKAAKIASEKMGLNYMQNVMMTYLMVNWWGRPDFVAYQFEDIDNVAFRNFRGLKFAWTVTNHEDYRKCVSRGIAPIFEQFNPKKRGDS